MREAGLLRNAQAFEATAARRVTIPPELDPDQIIREGREAGFRTDRVEADA